MSPASGREWAASATSSSSKGTPRTTRSLRPASTSCYGERLQHTIRAGGYDDVTLQAVTRPVRLGDDADDVTTFITSLPEATKLFADKPEVKVVAAIDALRQALEPHARPGGIVLNETAWLASARR
jgi:hypothetical protein